MGRSRNVSAGRCVTVRRVPVCNVWRPCPARLLARVPHRCPPTAPVSNQLSSCPCVRVFVSLAPPPPPRSACALDTCYNTPRARDRHLFKRLAYAARGGGGAQVFPRHSLERTSPRTVHTIPRPRAPRLSRGVPPLDRTCVVGTRRRSSRCLRQRVNDHAGSGTLRRIVILVITQYNRQRRVFTLRSLSTPTFVRSQRVICQP